VFFIHLSLFNNTMARIKFCPEPKEPFILPKKKRGRPPKSLSTLSAAYEARVTKIKLTQQDSILKTKTAHQGGNASDASQDSPVSPKRRRIADPSERRFDTHKKRRTASIDSSESNSAPEFNYGTRSKSRTNPDENRSPAATKKRDDGTLISGNLADITDVDNLVFPVQVVRVSWHPNPPLCPALNA